MSENNINNFKALIEQKRIVKKAIAKSLLAFGAPDNKSISKYRPVGILWEDLLEQIKKEVGTEDPEVFQGLVAQGTSDTSTSIMRYGVNVFTTATVTDYATKLPQPITGKRTTIINLSDRGISVYPSNVGGKINNLPINAPLIIPNDGKAYEFICTENPLPGNWNTITAPGIAQLEWVEIEIPHTNGVDSGGYGYTTANITNSLGLGVDGSGNITTTGPWLTESAPATITQMKCYTNILQTDLASEFIPDQITSHIWTGYKDGIASATSGPRINCWFSGGVNYDGNFAPVGTLNIPAEVGDTNTMYQEIPMSLTPFQNGVGDQMGPGGAFSRSYYSFAMWIPASAATKTYKFKIFIEYFT